jgi:ribosome-associated protein
LDKKETIKSNDFAIKAAVLAEHLNCKDIVVLDLRQSSPVTKYYVIATGTSARQMRTVSDEIAEAGRCDGFEKFGRAGYSQGKWILLDFVHVVVHIFDTEYRNYYDLDLLWGDCPHIEFEHNEGQSGEAGD